MKLLTSKVRLNTFIIIGTSVIYCLIFVLSYFFVGRGVAAVAILPAIVIGLFLGMWGGVIAGALSFPLNILLYYLLGEAVQSDEQITWAYERLKPALGAALDQVPTLYFFEGD